jgi:hypothetical protein
VSAERAASACLFLGCLSLALPLLGFTILAATDARPALGLIPAGVLVSIGALIAGGVALASGRNAPRSGRGTKMAFGMAAGGLSFGLGNFLVYDIAGHSRQTRNEAAAITAIRDVIAAKAADAREQERFGYRFALHRGPGAETFAYVAVPILPGRTGFRGFCGDDSGRICVTEDGTTPPLREGRCGGACRPLDR